jgi:hypothetical protein
MRPYRCMGKRILTDHREGERLNMPSKKLALVAPDTRTRDLLE